MITSQETIENVLDPQNIQDFATNILADLASFMTTMVNVASSSYSLSLEEKSLPGRFKAAFPGSYDRVRTIVSNSSEAISTYVISKATCSAGQAMVLAFLLWFMDIPGWFFVWGPMLLARLHPDSRSNPRYLASDDDRIDRARPPSGIAVRRSSYREPTTLRVIYRAQSLWQRLGISPLVLLLTVMVSASVWGISGAIIGVPIMIIARIALEEDERTGQSHSCSQ
ncbi:MAG: hypothetical protein Ct9H90mP24_5370 [Methanobacteriota archaeon]|nr:MAG: hypothetical protein Ct9H90mP24_5370 [Euryarchaeota archaeon]